MTDELYLIAHKVSGEPAFDIAQQMEVEFDDGPETWWIIPTSGHRAYPYWTMSLEAIKSYIPGDFFMWGPPPMPPDLPDHYQVNSEPKREKPTQADARKLLSSLGLLKSNQGPPLRRLT